MYAFIIVCNVMNCVIVCLFNIVYDYSMLISSLLCHCLIHMVSNYSDFNHKIKSDNQIRNKQKNVTRKS